MRMRPTTRRMRTKEASENLMDHLLFHLPFVLVLVLVLTRFRASWWSGVSQDDLVLYEISGVLRERLKACSPSGGHGESIRYPTSGEVRVRTLDPSYMEDRSRKLVILLAWHKGVYQISDVEDVRERSTMFKQ